MLTPEQAFRAMCVFLERYHQRLGSGPELEALLGDVQLNRNEAKPMDPAAWDDWLAAVDVALRSVRLEPAAADSTDSIPPSPERSTR